MSGVARLKPSSADLCGPSVQRWLGTISVDAKGMMTPRSGVSADGDEVGGVNTSVQCADYRWR